MAPLPTRSAGGWLERGADRLVDGRGLVLGGGERVDQAVAERAAHPVCRCRRRAGRAVGGWLRPSSQPLGVWQRRQYSPAPGASMLATCSAAHISGSRPAWLIMLPRQRS